MSETPNTVHGRLLEAVHISGYTFERACSEFKWLLEEDRWKTIGSGFQDINAFVATIDFSEFRIAVDQRKEIAKLLKSIEAGQRATAKMLGVDQKTVSNDLKAEELSSPAQPKAAKQVVETKPSEENSSPAWFQDDVDPAELAKKASKKSNAAEATKEKREQSRNAKPLPDGMELRIGDSRETLTNVPDNSVPLILTDPPYGDEAEPLYTWLAEWSARVLIPGGSLVCFTGQSRLDRDMRILSDKLRYWWLLIMLHHQSQRLPGKFIIAGFKPVLWYVKDHRRGRSLLPDILKSPARDKTLHNWAQGEGGVSAVIEHLTEPGELIVDPFAGTGKWGEIAHGMGRRWLGSDVAEGGAEMIAAE